MMNFEEHIQVPVKKFSQSLYGNMVSAGGEVVRKISMRKWTHQKCHIIIMHMSTLHVSLFLSNLYFFFASIDGYQI